MKSERVVASQTEFALYVTYNVLLLTGNEIAYALARYRVRLKVSLATLCPLKRFDSKRSSRM